MSAVDEEKSKLLKRLNRIRGQVEAMRRALEGQASSAAVLQQATACRGALDGFIAKMADRRGSTQMVIKSGISTANATASTVQQ